MRKFSKVFLVFNPSSGRRLAEKKAVKLEKLFLSSGLETVKLTSSSHHEDVANAKIIKKSKNSLVVVFGGDGTLGAVVGALTSVNAECVFAAFPSGTANDFASAAGVPKSVKRFFNFIMNKEPKKVDLMLVNSKKVAINAVGAGNFSNGSTNYNTKLKKIFGKYGYYLSCIKNFFNLASQELTFNIDGNITKVNAFLYFFVNSKRAGGFKNFAPNASINDGMFDLIIVKKCSKAACIKVLCDISRGRADKNENIICLKGKTGEVVGGEDNPKFSTCDIDGFSGLSGSLNVSVLPSQVEFLI